MSPRKRRLQRNVVRSISDRSRIIISSCRGDGSSDGSFSSSSKSSVLSTVKISNTSPAEGEQQARGLSVYSSMELLYS